jgi:hypothetical protein
MASYGGYGNGNGSYGAGSPYGYGGAAPGAPSYEYPSYGASASASSSGGTAATAAAAAASISTPSDAGLRRRAANPVPSYGSNTFGDDTNGKYKKGSNRAVVERLDILFPKVDREFIVQTKGGGIMSFVAYTLVAILCLAEIVTWMSQNGAELSRTSVDTLGPPVRRWR